MAAVYEQMGSARVRALKPKRQGVGFSITRPFVVKLSAGLTVIVLVEEDRGERKKVTASYRTQCCGARVVLNLGRPVCKNCEAVMRVSKAEREFVLYSGWRRDLVADDETITLMETWLAEKDPLAAIIEAPDAVDELLAVVRENQTLVRLSEKASMA